MPIPKRLSKKDSTALLAYLRHVWYWSQYYADLLDPNRVDPAKRSGATRSIDRLTTTARDAYWDLTGEFPK